VTSNGLFPVRLEAWVLQDGNYPGIARGMDTAFALEFQALSPLNLLKPDRQPGLRHTGSGHYEGAGRVLHVAEEWWVIDFSVRAFQQASPPAGARAGDVLGGAIRLSVDPHFYFAKLSKEPGAPALIYDWRVEKIEMQTAPLKRLTKRMLAREETQLGWAEIEAAEAWKDDGGHAEYLLHCRRTGGEARMAL
jgi:hypothetical protein